MLNKEQRTDHAVYDGWYDEWYSSNDGGHQEETRYRDSVVTYSNFMIITLQHILIIIIILIIIKLHYSY